MTSYKISLPSLPPREAIADALYRGVIAFDRNDADLLASSLTGENAIVEMNSDTKLVIEGASKVRDTLLAQVGPLDTSHMTSNVRIDHEDGALEASLSAYFTAQHCPQGSGGATDGPKFTTGGEYFLDLVKDESDGLWKAKKWVVDIVWRQGDDSFMH